MPRVSVILSSYNHADYIGESIQSILDQTFEDFELYIIDDCSTDDSWEVIKKYKDKRIIAIRNEENIGVVIRPEIVNKLKGEYMAIAHCDDRWQPTKLGKQVEFLDKNKQYGACFTLVNLIDDEGKKFVDELHPYYGIFEQENRSRLEWLRRFFYSGNALCHPSVLLRMKAQKDYNLYAVGLAALPDEYRWIKLCLHDNIYVYPEKLTDFRVRSAEGNSSGDKLDNRLRCNFESFVLPDLFKEVLEYPKKDFLTIFLGAEKYFVEGHNDREYIFARTLIEMHNAPYQLYGLNLLWNIMQDPKRKASLESKYHFMNKDFVEMTGMIDVFNFLSDREMMISAVYYDTGEGFNLNEVMSQAVYINDRNGFTITFDLSQIKGIRKMRFDPFENCFKRVKDIVITVDGEKKDYKISNHRVTEDGWIEFDDNDPQFVISGGGKKLTVTGIVGAIDDNEIWNEIDELNGQVRELQVSLELAQQTNWRKFRQWVQRRLGRK